MFSFRERYKNQWQKCLDRQARRLLKSGASSGFLVKILNLLMNALCIADRFSDARTVKVDLDSRRYHFKQFAFS